MKQKLILHRGSRGLIEELSMLENQKENQLEDVSYRGYVEELRGLSLSLALH